jgi:hypothetical protein
LDVGQQDHVKHISVIFVIEGISPSEKGKNSFGGRRLVMTELSGIAGNVFPSGSRPAAFEKAWFPKLKSTLYSVDSLVQYTEKQEQFFITFWFIRP